MLRRKTLAPSPTAQQQHPALTHPPWPPEKARRVSPGLGVSWRMTPAQRNLGKQVRTPLQLPAGILRSSVPNCPMPSPPHISITHPHAPNTQVHLGMHTRIHAAHHIHHVYARTHAFHTTIPHATHAHIHSCDTPDTHMNTQTHRHTPPLPGPSLPG